MKNLKEEKIMINCHLCDTPTSFKILCPNDLTIKEYPTKYLRFIERMIKMEYGCGIVAIRILMRCPYTEIF